MLKLSASKVLDLQIHCRNMTLCRNSSHPGDPDPVLAVTQDLIAYWYDAERLISTKNAELATMTTARDYWKGQYDALARLGGESR